MYPKAITSLSSVNYFGMAQQVKENDHDIGNLLSVFDQDAVCKARGANCWDMFFSHNQREGGQQTDLLATKLKVRGMNPWFDQWNGLGTKSAVIDVTKDGMKEVIMILGL